ncbi:MAG: aspartyl/glutamyl-tRNA amidotransferase subunit C [Spirochaetaceae bacterium]|jgi:aspartyl-tRNA(Asn)/glutamyl-tRNA(Gln) amidotransferase subunit C|nr:aspartyl/glutamyl-tRNA amidotransferase subunit C [Spirochaetaceae bacterium]
MKIEDLQETARLAHLNLDETELTGAFPAFEQMLGFFAAMQAADEDAGAFSASIASLNEPQWTAGSHHFRSDTVQNNANNPPCSADGLNENLLNNAGERDGRFIVVPNVL